MSNRYTAKNIQGPRILTFNDYQGMEDVVKELTGVSVTIKCFPSRISIRANSYADYLMARSVLKGRTSKEIHYDVLGKKETPTEAEREGQMARAFDATK